MDIETTALARYAAISSQLEGEPPMAYISPFVLEAHAYIGAFAWKRYKENGRGCVFIKPNPWRLSYPTDPADPHNTIIVSCLQGYKPDHQVFIGWEFEGQYYYSVVDTPYPPPMYDYLEDNIN